MISYDISVIGPSHSGKTTLIRSYLSKDPSTITSKLLFLSSCSLKFFSGSYISSKTIMLHNNKYVLKIYDEAGDTKYDGPLGISLQKRQAILICFSVYSRKSFEEAGEYIKLAVLNGQRHTFYMLIGTHSDIKEKNEKFLYAKEEEKTTEGNEGKARQISYDEAEAFASNLKWPYIETNAREDNKVEEAFETVLKEMLLRFPSFQPKLTANQPRKLQQQVDDDKSCAIF